MGGLFISHATADAGVAQAVCAGLEAGGMRCWIAPRDILPGRRYAEAIVDGIEECDVFVLVFSAAAGESPHVANEIEKAASKDKRIFLVRIDETDPQADREISLFLGSHHWFDATTGTIDEVLPRLVESMQRLLGRDAQGDGAVSSAPRAGAARPAANGDGAVSQGVAAARSIGIDIGSSKIRGWIEVLDDAVDHFDPTPYMEPVVRPATPRTLLEQVTRLVTRLMDDHFTESSPPVGIGVAVPGMVDARAGTLKFSPGLALRNVPFKTTLGNAFNGLRVRVDNDTRCATRCELHFGVGHEFDDFACIFIGTGVGSGLVLGGRVHFGHRYCAGEIGHTKIESNGPPCTCGQIGCLETFVNATAIVARARAKAIDWESRGSETLLTSDDSLTPEMIAAAIDDGDVAATEVADEIADKLGIGIANYLNLLNPGAVVLGGGIMTGFYLHVIDRVTQTVQSNALAEVANTPIVQSQFSDHAAAVGAALLFHDDDGWPY